ncbi:MAG: BlaI/MecI/CopY family transcriptional regulator [Planctomycetaceae bacterium]|nr:BlaI/MecI/CopY family transcriptional regulator [Planctomycetaceae bacterium]
MPETMPTERELEVLKILWHREKITVRELWKMMLEKQPELGYTAVLTLLQYMEKKDMVAHEAVGKAYHYYALRKEKETISGMVRRFVNSVFNGATDAWIAHALEHEPMSTEELDALEEKIRSAKAKKTKRRGK